MAPRRRCPTCGSKQWHKEPSSGLIACSEGHVLQNYRNEATDVAENMGQHALRKRTLKSERKKRERGSDANPELYHGARGRHLYFECQQLLLRKQVAALTRLWSLPPEFEIICRDIWALHLMLLPNPPLAEPYHYDQGLNQGTGGEHSTSNTEKSDAITSESQSSRSPVPPERKYAGSDREKSDKGEEESEDSQQGGGEEEGEDDDPELAALLQMNSDISSSSDSDDETGGEPKRQEQGANKKGRRRKGRYMYESPASTVAVLIIACWTMRIPVMCRDFTRLIEAYKLPYLDPVSRRLLPASMTAHLTKHNIQALSQYHAPSVMMLHGLASRLSKRMYMTYGIFTPEANGAPILWRVVSQGLAGTPTLYTLTKRLSHVLSLPLTLHHTLSPGLERLKAYDPSKHSYDHVPPEVSFVSAGMMVIKMVYGLDGRKRLPSEPSDPACALPRIDEYIRLVNEMNDRDSKRKEELFSSRSPMCGGDLRETMIDEYLDFCERALLGESNGGGEDSLLESYFPLPGCYGEAGTESAGEADRHLAAGVMREQGELRPGERYRIYNSRDLFGTLPGDYEVVMERGSRWVGVSVDFLGGVVETYERRLVRWWELEKRASR